MWASTVGLVNGKHRYLTAETFGFKINSNGQALKKRQQWTIEPFPENLGPDGSISSAASVSSQCVVGATAGNQQQPSVPQQPQPLQQQQQQSLDPNDPCILTFSSGFVGSSLTSVKSSSNGSSSNSDQDACGEEHENVAIKSHLNKYLAVDSFGNVTCDSDEKTENARFTITICSMSQGRSKDEHIFWAFKNVERGYFLGTTDDGMICCNAKMPKSRNELWHLHLLPARGASFFVLKSLGRKRFARVAKNDNIHRAQQDQHCANNDKMNNGLQPAAAQVQLDATITWGPETLFQFKYFQGGRYSLLTSNCLYLTNEGKCVQWKQQDESSLPPPECLFTLEYHSGYLAFRDSFSHYLAAAGRSSVLRSRSIGVSRDELFLFEGAPIQVSLKATFNDRWVSIKQGVDLSANQTETTPAYETFQMTFHKQTQNWSIMTHECGFWTASQTTSTISVCKPGDYEGLIRGQFKLIWSESDATCSLKHVDASSQERWISARKSGQLFLAATSGASQTPPVKFIMRFQNRRLLNLRPVEGSGFVGLKASINCKQLEATKTSPDSIAIEYSELPSSANSQPNGLFSRTSEPETTSNSMVDCSSNNQQRFNLFNIKLNSVKTSNNNNNNNNNIINIRSQQPQTVDNVSQSQQQKEIELFGVDDNNNNCMMPPIDCNNSQGQESHNKKPQSVSTNGSVELAAAPSVASIISSFSSVRVTSTNGNGARQQQQQSAGRATNSSVFKLASSFDSPGQQLNDSACSDTASVITSCSTASGSSSASAGSQQQQQQLDCNNQKTNPDQLAQFECCYLKTISNDRYLVVGGGSDSSVVCDATNKACAQPWILELRSHNSVAIRASDNHAYMQLGTNGTVYLSRCDPKEASLWEF